MAIKKGKTNEGQFSITQANLDKKGKTNKKLKRNTMASKYLTSTGRDLKEKAEANAKATYKKGRRYSKETS